MEFLTQLWLPIVVSAVFVFVASSIIHMVLPIHKGDYGKMRNEDAVLASMRASGVEPGQYMFPCAASMKDMSSPEMVAKVKAGPVGYLNILPPGGFNIGRSLVLWFLYTVLVSLLAAYVGWHALGVTNDYLAVFRIVGVAAILGYAVGVIDNSIWKGVRWSTTAKFVFDGVVYGLVTAGTFAWLWPDAPAGL
jgi:hypothetical protein